jgi:hypothetical protein
MAMTVVRKMRLVGDGHDGGKEDEEGLTAVTGSECAGSSLSMAPLRTSHSRTVSSKLPLTCSRRSVA